MPAYTKEEMRAALEAEMAAGDIREPRLIVDELVKIRAAVDDALGTERERSIYLLQLVARDPQLSSRACTALSHGYSRTECEQRWGKEFQL